MAPMRRFHNIILCALLVVMLGCSSNGNNQSDTSTDTSTPPDTAADAPITPPDTALCAEYCTLIESLCTDENSIKFGGSTCEMVCPTFPAGEPGTMAGDTLACRLSYLKDSTKPANEACAAASPPGGTPEIGFFCSDGNTSCGCLTDEDKSIIKSIEPLSVGGKCSEQCTADSSTDCFLSCVAQDTGVTEGCAECVLNLSRCAENDCASDCGSSNQTPECDACIASKCMDGFNACTGQGPSGPQCGDGECNEGENDTCPEDCGTTDNCGNGSCDAFESMDSCPQDCDPEAGSCVGTCGNFQADAKCHCDKLCEDSNNCCTDYWTECSGEPGTCGNGECEQNENDDNCPDDCAATAVCGNGTCDETENDQSCPEDCKPETSVCGNGECDEDETDQTCPADCEPEVAVCGNGQCDEGENDQSCPSDCEAEGSSECGNGQCEEGEDPTNCPADCKD